MKRICKETFFMICIKWRNWWTTLKGEKQVKKRSYVMHFRTVLDNSSTRCRLYRNIYGEQFLAYNVFFAFKVAKLLTNIFVRLQKWLSMLRSKPRVKLSLASSVWCGSSHGVVYIHYGEILLFLFFCCLVTIAYG